MTVFDPKHPVVMSLRTHAGNLRNGDLLQFRSRAWISWLIQVGTLGVHSHSAMIRVNGSDRIDCLEMMEGAGGRARPLAARVQEQPGRIDVFRADTARWPKLDLAKAVDKMREFTGREYGQANLLWLAGMRAFGLRFFLHRRARDVRDDWKPSRALFCSEAVCAAYRLAGVDPVPRKPDRLTTPADLTCSLLFAYVGTLVP